MGPTSTSGLLTGWGWSVRLWEVKGPWQFWVTVVLMFPYFLVPRSATLLPQPGVTKMPILEKSPQKMEAKPPSSEEEPVSDFWSPISYPFSLHPHTLLPE